MKNRKPVTIMLLHVLMFYLLPPVSKSIGPMGTVLLLVLGTFALSVMMGACPAAKGKLLYPLFTAAVFIPSVFLFYNESAMIHAVWYLVISLAGVLIGMMTGRTSKQ